MSAISFRAVSGIFADTGAIKAKGEFLGLLGVIANDAGPGGSAITVQIAGGGTAGAETVAWTGNSVLITVELGVSTLAQVLAATPSGTPLAALYALPTASTAATIDTAVAATALPAADNGVAGSYRVLMEAELDANTRTSILPTLYVRNAEDGADNINDATVVVEESSDGKTWYSLVVGLAVEAYAFKRVALSNKRPKIRVSGYCAAGEATALQLQLMVGDY